jgi:hypothetical protein
MKSFPIINIKYLSSLYVYVCKHTYVLCTDEYSSMLYIHPGLGIYSLRNRGWALCEKGDIYICTHYYHMCRINVNSPTLPFFTSLLPPREGSRIPVSLLTRSSPLPYLREYLPSLQQLFYAKGLTQQPTSPDLSSRLLSPSPPPACPSSIFHPHAHSLYAVALPLRSMLHR